ncbi:TolC family protein [Desulfovibrio oxyclinae]|uniref:TolC family protein n=1 Tax=Desulfovibrio oxyclinae TaxID=63560 RepID=UPI000363CFC1|nr:TolC family protein [Desulfovibrio oxyclinae]
MTKRFTVFSLCLFMLLSAVTVQAQTSAKADPAVNGAYTLERCVQRALEANPTILAAKSQIQGADYGTKSARGDFLPSVTAGYDYKTYNREQSGGITAEHGKSSYTGSIVVTQPIFKGFSLLNNYQKQKLTKKRQEANLNNVELVVIQDVQTNFLALLKARMDVKSAEDSVERLRSQLKVNTAFYDVGLKPRVDVLQAEVELATAEQDLLKARNAVSTQTAKLNSLLNLPLTADINYVGDLQYDPFNLTLRQCLDRAYEFRPDLKIGEKAVEIAAKDAGIASSSFMPSVDGTVTYTKNSDEPGLQDEGYFTHESSETLTAGVSATWTVWQWGADYYDYKRTDEVVTQLEAELEDTRLNAGFEVKQALLSIREASDRIGVARKSVESAKESYRMALARYQAQVGTNNDVLDAQSRVTSSEAQLIEALADYNTAVANLYVAMGEKNPSLEVE